MVENPLKPAILTEPAFVGREQELERLQQSLDAARTGNGTTLFVFGEAGAGKTRLVKEFLKTVKGEQATIMRGFCISKTPVPYFPFIEAFNTLYSSDGSKGTISSAEEHFGIVGWLKGNEMAATESLGISGWLKGPKHEESTRKQSTPSAEIRKDMTFTAVTQTLHSVSSKKPLILFIDDIHWADSASLALTHYISRTISSSKILIIATARIEETSQDSEGHTQPMTETLQLMRREDLFVEIRIPSLDRHQVEKLAELMVDGEIEDEFAEKLSRESQGNPLFAVESVRMFIEAGNLVCRDGTWCLTAKELSIPTKVRDVILYRLNRLNAAQRRMLDLGSVIGERFDPSLIGSVLSQDKLVVLETLNAIARSTFLINPVENMYKFSHGKFREVLYDEMPALLKREYHERVAEKIEATSRQDELPVNDLAYHYVQAGHSDTAVRYSLAAGEDALKRFSNAEAAKHFEYVFKATQDDPEHKNEKLTALEGLGDAYSAAGAFEEASKTFEHLSAIAESGEKRLRALRKSMIASFHRGDFPHALELAHRAEKDSNFDKLEYARVQMYKTKTNNFRGNIPFANAFSELDSCLKIFEEKNSDPDVADSLMEIGTLYVTASQGQKAIVALRRAIQLYEKLGNSRRQAEAYFWIGMAQFTEGACNKEALDNWTKVIEIGEKVCEFNRMAWARLYSGLLYESVDELQAALEDSLEGIEYAEKTDSYYIRSMLYANIVRASAKLEDAEHLVEFRDKFTKSFADAGRTSSKTAQAVGIRTEAVLLASDRQWEEANKHIERCLEIYRGAGTVIVHEAMARTDYAWILKKQGRSEDAKKQIEESIKLYEKLDKKQHVERLNAMLKENF